MYKIYRKNCVSVCILLCLWLKISLFRHLGYDKNVFVEEMVCFEATEELG